jgi:hypothetical protein
VSLQHDNGDDAHSISSSANFDACNCVSVIGGSNSACSSVLWLLRAYMTRIADFAHVISSFTVNLDSQKMKLFCKTSENVRRYTA